MNITAGWTKTWADTAVCVIVCVCACTPLTDCLRNSSRRSHDSICICLIRSLGAVHRATPSLPHSLHPAPPSAIRHPAVVIGTWRTFLSTNQRAGKGIWRAPSTYFSRMHSYNYSIISNIGYNLPLTAAHVNAIHHCHLL